MTTINGSTIDDEVAAEGSYINSERIVSLLTVIDREPGIVDKVLGVVYVITVITSTILSYSRAIPGMVCNTPIRGYCHILL